MSSVAPHSHLPYGEEGCAFYSEHTQGCFQVIESSCDLVWRAMQKVLLVNQERRFLSVADFGANDGGTSTFLWKQIFGNIRRDYPDLPIWLHYEDQATNDWKSLFLLVHGLVKAADSSSMISIKKLFNNVSVSCCGTSFYELCFPPCSLQFIYSATAMHWLASPLEVKIKDAVHCAASKDSKVKEIIKKQAAKDWECNLLHRAKELAPGGQMVLVNLGMDEDGQYLGNTRNNPVNIFQKFFDLWSALKDNERITQEEFDNTCFANYYRTCDEIKEPFRDENSPVCTAGLRLCSVEVKHIPCTYRSYLETHKDMDSKEFALWYVPTLRTWSNSTFYNALSHDRSAEERSNIVDELFDAYTKEVQQNPFQHGMDYIHTHVHIEKIV